MQEQPKIKTPEEILAEKKAAFEKEPDRFIDMKEIVFCAVRDPSGGIAHYTGSARRTQYNLTKSECQYQIDKILREMDALKEKKKRGIINPFSKKTGAFGKTHN